MKYFKRADKLHVRFSFNEETMEVSEHTPKEFVPKEMQPWMGGDEMVQNTELTAFPYKCDHTGKGMCGGFCIEDGAVYIEEEKHMIEHIKEETKYKDLQEAYDDGYYYWSEWFEAEFIGDRFFDDAGREYTLIKIK